MPTPVPLCRALEGESKALAESRRAGKLPVWNHSEFQVLYTPPDKVLKVGDVYVNYLLDNQNDPRAVESLQEPRQFFDKLYLHLVFALAGVQPSSLEVRLPHPHSPPAATRSLQRAAFRPPCLRRRPLPVHSTDAAAGRRLCRG